MVDDNTLILSKVIQSYTEEALSFKISGMKNVNYYSKGSSFQLNIKDTNGKMISQQLDDIIYETIPGDITLISFEATNQELSATANYIFSFTINTNLNEGKRKFY